MEKPVVFVVSADAAVSDSLKDLLETAGLSAEIFPSALAFLDTVGPDRQGCLVLDVQSGDQKDSVEQARLAVVYARMPAILITDRCDVPTAVEAVKAGAMDVVQKPYGARNCWRLSVMRCRQTQRPRLDRPVGPVYVRRFTYVA